MLVLRWFYKVVRENVVLYIGFTKVVREKLYKTYVKIVIFRGQPTRHGFATAAGLKLPSQQA